MSRLSEILGVSEGQTFRFNTRYFCNMAEKYKIQNGKRYAMYDGGWIEGRCEALLIEMINHPELIEITPKLTTKQIVAIKGRIKEGTPWAAKNTHTTNNIFFFKEKPKLNKRNFWNTDDGDWISATIGDENIFDFIAAGECIYLPDLIGGAENE